MSRHRNVRSMNYEEDYYDEDDVYGHSVEDNYCISPGTAAQFTFNRGERNVDLSNFMGEEGGIPEVSEEQEEAESETPETTPRSQHRSSLDYTRPKLSELDDAKLNSCLEEIRNVLGESVPENVLVDTIVKHNFTLESSLNELLTQQDVPKPQRGPRQNRRNRSQEYADDLDYNSQSPAQGDVFSYIPDYLNVSGHMKFGGSCSPQSPLLPKHYMSQKTDQTHGEVIVEHHFAFEPSSKLINAQIKDTTDIYIHEHSKDINTKSDKLEIGQQAVSKSSHEQRKSEVSPCKRETLGDITTTHQSNQITQNLQDSMKPQDNERIQSKLSPGRTIIPIPKPQQSSSSNIILQGVDKKQDVLEKPVSQQSRTQNATISLSELGKTHETFNKPSIDLKSLSQISHGKQSAISSGTKFSDLSKQTRVDKDKQLSDVKPKSGLSLSDLAKNQNSLSLNSVSPLSSLGKSPAMKLTESNSKLNAGLSLSDLAQHHGVNKTTPTTHQIVGISLSSLASAHGVNKHSEQNIGQSQGKSLSDLAIRHQADKSEQKLSQSPGLSLSELASAHGVRKPESDITTRLSSPITKQLEQQKEQTQGLSLAEMAKAQQGVGKTMPSWSMSSQNVKSKDKTETMLSLSNLVEKLSKKEENKSSGVTIEHHCGFESLSANNSPNLQNTLLSSLGKSPPISLSDLAKCKTPKASVVNKTVAKTSSDDLSKLEPKLKTENKETTISSDDLSKESQSVEGVLNYNVGDVIDTVSIKGLITKASNIGKALCLEMTVSRKKRSKNLTARISYRHKQFSYKNQMREIKSKSPEHLRKVVAFDFSTPSPDDIIKLKQKSAFTRSGERKIST